MTTDADLEELRSAYALLRAENARLREELQFKSRFDADAEIRRLRATIARIEALPAKWLDDVAYQRESVADCAVDVECALRGRP